MFLNSLKHLKKWFIEAKLTEHKMNHFKVNTSEAFRTFTTLVTNTSFYVVSKYFQSLQTKTSYPLSSFFPFCPLPSLWQTTICFLSLRIYLFWLFNVNRIIQYVTSCVWLLWLNIIFLRFIHVVACISTSFSFMVE